MQLWSSDWLAIMVYEPLYHALQTDGNCTRPLKLKNKLKIGCFYETKSGRILDILWAF